MTEPVSIHRDGEDWGPYSQEEAAQLISSGNLLVSDLAWHEGLSEWQPLGSLPEFSSLFTAPSPPPNPATASGPKLLIPSAGEAVAAANAAATANEAAAAALRATKNLRLRRIKNTGIFMIVIWVVVVLFLHFTSNPAFELVTLSGIATFIVIRLIFSFVGGDRGGSSGGGSSSCSVGSSCSSCSSCGGGGD